MPGIVAAASDRWRLTVAEPFPGLSYNWVAPCRLADGRDAVLKAGPWLEDLAREADALRAYSGRGCVRLLAHDEPAGLLLIERVFPGDLLTSRLHDEVASTSAAADVMRALGAVLPPAGHRFPAAGDWARSLGRLRERYSGQCGPMEPHSFSRAEATYRAFLAAPNGHALLHGDLHHYNILRSGEGWLAIDPHGVVAEPEYECGALLRNPLDIIDRRDAPAVLHRRALQLCDELGYDRFRVLAWAGAQLVLSVTWTVLDEEDSATVRWLPLATALFEAADQYA